MYIFGSAKLCVAVYFTIMFPIASLLQKQSLVKSFAYQTYKRIVMFVAEHIKTLEAAHIELMNLVFRQY